MRFQFSLTTLLVCMTVLAMVAAISVAVPVHEHVVASPTGPPFDAVFGEFDWQRPPGLDEVLHRSILFGTPAVLVMLTAL
jgi:hypothetical protein